MQKQNELSFGEKLVNSVASGVISGVISGGIGLTTEGREGLFNIANTLGTWGLETHKQKKIDSFFEYVENLKNR